MVSFITLSGSLFITLSAKSLLHYPGGCLLHYRLNLLHYREVLHYRLIFITLSGSITLSGVYYIIGCNRQAPLTIQSSVLHFQACQNHRNIPMYVLWSKPPLLSYLSRIDFYDV